MPCAHLLEVALRLLFAGCAGPLARICGGEHALRLLIGAHGARKVRKQGACVCGARVVVVGREELYQLAFELGCACGSLGGLGCGHVAGVREALVGLHVCLEGHEALLRVVSRDVVPCEELVELAA